MDFLVGYSGFVGSNLAEQHVFDGLFRSGNIREAYGRHPDLLVYAGVRAEMFLANRDPSADLQHIEDAISNIREIAPRECILISSIAVYPDSRGADENTIPDPARLTAYGKHRLMLENWVYENIPKSLIVRLPAIYGKNLKKNFLYDYIHVIPSLLTEEKLQSLSVEAPVLKEFYLPKGNGFFQCRACSEEETEMLKAIFRRLGFSALNFTDSRSVYQFYSLKHLWAHIQIARDAGLRKVNLATPPLAVSEVYHFLSGEEFVCHLNREPYDYDLHTRFDALYGGADGYIMSRTEELDDIAQFVRAETGTAL